MYLKDKLEPTEAVTYTPDLRGMIAWLETMPQDTSYAFASIDDCVICRFAKAAGFWSGYYGNAADKLGRGVVLACCPGRSYSELLPDLLRALALRGK